MTMRELERWIGWEIAGHYHQRIHGSLLLCPESTPRRTFSWPHKNDAISHARVLPQDRIFVWGCPCLRTGVGR
jgi:hypothetical protein